MFENIGGKIKMLAKVCCWIGIVVSVISGIIFLSENNNEVIGLLVLILGPLVSWISSFLTYGLGQLIENSDKLVELNLSNNRNFKSEKGNVQNESCQKENSIKSDIPKEEQLKFLMEKNLITEEEYASKLKELNGGLND